MILILNVVKYLGGADGAATTRTDPLTLELVELVGAVVARYLDEYEEAASRGGRRRLSARPRAAKGRRPAAGRLPDAGG